MPVGAMCPFGTREFASYQIAIRRTAYEKENPYFNAIIGRVANRIENAKFKINKTEYQYMVIRAMSQNNYDERKIRQKR